MDTINKITIHNLHFALFQGLAFVQLMLALLISFYIILQINLKQYHKQLTHSNVHSTQNNAIITHISKKDMKRP
jgi:hypothetical protein